MELNYRLLTIEDKGRIQTINRTQNQVISTYSFPVLFCWQKPLALETALMDDFYVVRHQVLPEYFFPCGPIEKTQCFVENLIEANSPFTLFHLSSAQAEWIRERYPMLWLWEDRDNFDYIYSTQKLSRLPGKCYRNLRHEFHQIERASPVFVEPLTPQNMAAAWELTQKWAEENHLNDCEADLAATQTGLTHFGDLDLEGLLIQDDQGPVSVIIGSAMSDSIFDCHFTKSIGSLPGHGSFAFHAIAAYMENRFEVLNLEEDLGIPGLRYKKTILNPVELLPVFCCSNVPNQIKECDKR